MPFSHHSHSGQFCAHASGSLESIVQRAIQSRMIVYALTEHIGRDIIDLYPEEDAIIKSAKDFAKITANFYQEAKRLKVHYKSQIDLLIGFESEWIRPSSLDIVRDLQSNYDWDIFVGSVHHVHTIPIDYDRLLYEKAREKSGGTDLQLFSDYFDAQYDMLQALRPPIVGHFDLIRLLSDLRNVDMREYPSLWQKVLRNLEYVISYNGILEINTSALRKGLNEPYPSEPICKVFLGLGGRFTLSDDAHAVEHVGICYEKVQRFLKNAGIEFLHYFAPVDATAAGSEVKAISVSSLGDNPLMTVSLD